MSLNAAEQSSRRHWGPSRHANSDPYICMDIAFHFAPTTRLSKPCLPHQDTSHSGSTAGWGSILPFNFTTLFPPSKENKVDLLFSDKPDSRSPAAWILLCHGVSTNWEKDRRSLRSPKSARHD